MRQGNEIYIKEAIGMPLVRMEAYLLCKAIDLGCNENYTWGTHKGVPFIRPKKVDN